MSLSLSWEQVSESLSSDIHSRASDIEMAPEVCPLDPTFRTVLAPQIISLGAIGRGELLPRGEANSQGFRSSVGKTRKQ